ncbi:MAG: carbohydrate ABC transporter permease [Oscillospiraceae bacterium]|mgnify:FL=1|jgi:multiple sugar transport system permease protein|nr:carbohydrate ABC transporter permease [Oscillospiraceae bacterium]
MPEAAKALCLKIDTEKKREKNLKLKRAVPKFFLNLFMAVILVGISYVILSPLIGIVSHSFMSINDYYNPLVYLIPEQGTLSNYRTAWQQIQYPNSLAYTLILSSVIMLIQTFICGFVGYGFARFRFPGRNLLFAMVIATIVVPVQTFMVPLYGQFRNFDIAGILHLLTGHGANLLNTPVPILLMSVFGSGLRSGLFIYIFRQFFKGLPKEIEWAAFIDGAGPFYTYFVVMLPNAGSAIITVLLFSFVWQYNDVFFASLFMDDSNLLSIQITTLTPKLAQTLQIRDPNQVMLIVHAGVVLTIIPLIIVYLLLQKHFMESVDRSGIVG